MKTQSKQTEVVIIGAGYAGLLAAIRLAGKTRRQPVKITLVNASDTFVERVRLHEFAANQDIKARPLTQALRGTGVEFVQGDVRSIDTAGHTLAVQTEVGPRQIGYDKLVYALGSLTNRDAVPGVRDYAYTLVRSGPLSAEALRERLPRANEAGGRLVVVGAGPTGIEAAAEFASGYPGLKVALVTRSAFGRFTGHQVANYMRRSLERLGVEIREHTTVTEVKPGEIATSVGAIPCDICLWTGGFLATPLARESGLAVNERGQVLVDPFLRSVSHPDVLAVGDAAFPVEEPGAKVRMSAFTATIMGAQGADNLAAMLRGREPKPLSFRYVGQGIALGRNNAIGFGLTPDDRPKGYYFTGRTGFAIRGFFVRFLAALPRFERRWPGFFFWVGKERYTQSKSTIQQRPQVDSSL